MCGNDLRFAVDHLIEMSGRHGGITSRMYQKACDEFLVCPDTLAKKFRMKTGNNWQDYRLSVPRSHDEGVTLAQGIARDRFTKSNDWWERYGQHCGKIFKVKRQKYVYIGAKIDGTGNPIHHFVRVKDLRGFTAIWTEVHASFPGLSDILI
jgi:hypothetical protein